MSCSTLADADNLQETVISIAAFKCALTLQPEFHWMAKSCSYFQDTPQLSLRNTLVKAPARSAAHRNKKNQFLIVSCVALWEWQSLAHKSAAIVPVFTSTPLCQSNFLFSLRNELYGRVCRVSVPWYYEKWWSWQDDNVVIIKCDVCIRPQRLSVLAFISFFFAEKVCPWSRNVCYVNVTKNICHRSAGTWVRVMLSRALTRLSWHGQKLTCYFVAGPLL